MNLHIVTGNIFEQDAHAIVNTVNCVGVMGKGLALEFKRRYPAMYRDYRLACQQNKLHTGSVYPYQLDATHWIVNFPTKRDWRNPSRIEWIATGLDDLVAWCNRLQIPSLALPALGCQNGGLALKVVQPLIAAAAQKLTCTALTLVFYDNGRG